MTERVSLEEVRSVCGGDYSLADQVVELLEREAKAAREEERSAIAEKLDELSSIRKAKVMVGMSGYEQDVGNCFLAESILELASNVIKTGHPEEL